MTDRTRIIAAGDAIINRRITALADADFLELRDLLHSADTAIVNFEATTPRRPLVPSPAHGLSVSAPAFVVDELRWLGFDLFNVANNHTTAFGWQGLNDTLDEFAARGVPTAGGGRTLSEARAPAYHDGPRARVALLGVTSTNAEAATAADPGRGDAGRPGAAPLRFSLEYALDPGRFANLVDIDEAVGAAAARSAQAAFRGRPAPTNGDALSFLGRSFVCGPQSGVRGRLDASDIAALERAIGEATRQADFVCVSIHCHESPSGGWNGSEPPDFLVEAAHRCVDAGADLVAGHGPHRLRGIEIHQGRPIFYSLGNLFLQIETVEPVPRAAFEEAGLSADGVAADYHDNDWIGQDGQPIGFAADPVWFETVLPVCEFDDRGLAELRLHPVELGRDLPRSRRGVPRLVDRERGRVILERLATLSRDLGTELTIVDDGQRTVATLAGGGTTVDDHWATAANVRS